VNSSFLGGLALGLVIGAGGIFALLEKPWASGEEVQAATMDAGSPDDLDEPKKNKKRRGKRRRAGSGSGELQEIDERVQLTAADRQLVWRGPKIVAPNKDVDFGEGGDGRSLDDSEIDQGIQPKQDKFVSCIADARGQAELAANITLKLLVNGKGGVQKVRVRAPSYLLKHGLYDCATEVARTMRFPASGAPTVVTVPFNLSF
jgi:hypothetical protein